MQNRKGPDKTGPHFLL